MTRLHALGLGLLLAMTVPAYSQDKAAPKPAPAAAPAATAPAPASPTTPATAPAATTPLAATAAAKPATTASPTPAAAPVAAAPAVAPAAAPAAAAAKPAAAPAAPMAAEKADAPKKRRVAMKRKPKDTCTKLDDPWDNVCDIRKKAQLACNDLPTGQKAAKKPKKGQTPMTTENRRQQCVDNYMRNV